jgi:tRNA-(ms[2]io[6]A)-hydroxylase
VLGLLRPTDPTWAERAARALDRVLADHAHCEMKAASNALALSTRCFDTPRVIRALLDLAEEELRHYRQVLDELDRRGLALGAPEEDYYAAELRRRVSGRRSDRSVRRVIVDRLLVGALIEARSCERFRLLARALDAKEPALALFYDELFVAEARHHRTLIDIALDLEPDESQVRSRLAAIAAIEADVVASLAGGPTIHG